MSFLNEHHRIWFGQIETLSKIVQTSNHRTCVPLYFEIIRLMQQVGINTKLKTFVDNNDPCVTNYKIEAMDQIIGHFLQDPLLFMREPKLFQTHEDSIFSLLKDFTVFRENDEPKEERQRKKRRNF